MKNLALKFFKRDLNISLDERRKDFIFFVGIGLICLGIPYIPLFMFFGFFEQALAVVPCVLLFGFSVFLCKKGVHNSAGLLLIATVSCAILYFGAVLGKDSGAHAMFYAMAALPITFFKKTDYKNRYLGFAMPICSYFFLEWVGFKKVSPINISLAYETYIQLTISSTVFFIIIGCVKLFHSFAVQSESRLLEQNQVLSETNQNLDKAKAIIDNDIRAAQIVQRSTIPQKFPKPDGVIITHWYQAARGVGGDFIDGIALDEHRTLIICGDIVGKGIQASLKMAAFYPMFRMLVEGFTDVQDLVLRCSKAVEKFYEFTQYIPCTIALIDSKEQTLTFCNAGHEGGYLLRGDQVIELLTGGPPFGADIDPVYAVETIPLQAGDRLVIFTDGFPDLKNPEGSRLKHQDALRIIKAVHEEVQNAESPEFFIDRVSQEFMVYKDNAPQADDMAIVSIEIGQRKEVQTV